MINFMAAIRLFIGAAMLFVAFLNPASAHHSRNNFLLNQTVSVSGKVTEWSFRSPHAWISLEVKNSNGSMTTYTIEGGSVGSLRRFGWDKESLSIGDYVTVVGNPDRQAKNKLLYLNSVAKADGTVLVVTGEPVVAARKQGNVVEPSRDFGGVWTRVATEQYFNVGAFEPPRDWPLTEKGRAQVDNFTMRDDPMVKCIPPALPRFSYAPFRHRWTRQGDSLTIEKELSPFQRTVQLGVREFPEQLQPSRMGTSIGWIDDAGVLHLETRGFIDDAWGSYRGLDSSTEKVVRETYTLADDGLSMALELSVEDPVYLTEPHTEEWKLVKGPAFDGDLGKLDCDIESAGRHLEFEFDN